MAKILIVEDEAAARNALSTLLMSVGYEVCLAWSATGALKALTIEKPDLVLLDIDLGELELSGIDIARLMAEDDRWKSIPVIVTSALPSEDVRRRARSNAFEGLRTLMMPKPLDMDNLTDQVARMLASDAPKRVL